MTPTQSLQAQEAAHNRQVQSVQNAMTRQLNGRDAQMAANDRRLQAEQTKAAAQVKQKGQGWYDRFLNSANRRHDAQAAAISRAKGTERAAFQSRLDRLGPGPAHPPPVTTQTVNV
jgi:hypothetical protein